MIQSAVGLQWDGTTWKPGIMQPQALDAVMRRYQAELVGWYGWLNGSKGVIEECGIPHNGDVSSWTPVMDWYLNQADQLGLPFLSWASGATMHTDPMAVYSVGNSEWWNNTLDTTFAQAATYEKHYGNQLSGTNLVGASFSSGGPGSTLLSNSTYFSNANLGTNGQDYSWPQTGDWAYLASHGVKKVRLHVSWERLQPTLGGTLNMSELSLLQAALAAAAAQGIGVLVSPYNGKGYAIGTDPYTVTTYAMPQLNPTGLVTSAHFADFWGRMAQALHGTPGFFGYALCNEPYTLAEGTGLSAEVGTGGSFESGAGNWSAMGGATLSIDTTHQRSGSQSLQITPPASPTGNVGATVAVTMAAGQKFFAEGWMRSAVSNRVPFQIQAYYVAASGVGVGQDYGNYTYAYAGRTTAPALTYGYTPSRLASTVPTLATHFNFIISTLSTPSASDVFYIDDCGVYPATNIYTAAQVWEQLTQAAVDAIRGYDASSEIWVEGQDSDPLNTPKVHPNGPWIQNASRNGLDTNIRYATHHYPDNSNTNKTTGTGAGTFPSSYSTYLAAAQSAHY